MSTLAPPQPAIGDGPQVVRDAIERVTAMSGGSYWFLVLAGEQQGEDWWTRDAAVNGLDELFTAFPAGEGRSAESVQGSLLLEAWAWTILAPSAAALMGTGVVFDLGCPSVQVQAPPGQRPVFLAINPEAAWAQAPRVADPDDPASIDLLLGPLVAHLTPLVGAIADRTGRSRSALWRGVRDRLAGTLLWAGEATNRRPIAEQMLLRAFGEGRVKGPVPRLVMPEGPATGVADGGEPAKPSLIRGGCCLWWRAGNDPCETCPLSQRDQLAAD